MTKYQQYFQQMLVQNKEAFDSFKEIHDKYLLDPDAWQDKFNQEGYLIQDIIRDYENRLCGHSESSGYSKFTTNLAEKFQAEVLKMFPKINSIGLIL